MTTNVLEQLKEVESQLASQVESLSDQLSAAEEQRKGLQTVINLFQSNGSADGVAANMTEILTSAAVSVAEPDLDEEEEEEEEEEAPVVKRPAKRRGRKPSAKAAEKVKVAPKAKIAKAKVAPVAPKVGRKPRGGKSPNWQRYVQDPFRKTPLPDVVANILKAQPDEAFKIAEVMEAIFKSDMPKATFLKARNRVSNILSAGARTNEWYRGRGGKYSMNSKALK